MNSVKYLVEISIQRKDIHHLFYCIYHEGSLVQCMHQSICIYSFSEKTKKKKTKLEKENRFFFSVFFWFGSIYLPSIFYGKMFDARFFTLAFVTFFFCTITYTFVVFTIANFKDTRTLTFWFEYWFK